ncbi:hypothetical protein GIB67_036286 [Kingdonia uniflora]|uniref:Partial AB-hydrolase lipase domain-containing protein n=1 Tax=Kingdonia uniflora TaxID=39325 RepID=A0A7J7L3U4_9MAGN|nr:hypothetical protein GIB67_036286 [Kingdonia uniflora]
MRFSFLSEDIAKVLEFIDLVVVRLDRLKQLTVSSPLWSTMSVKTFTYESINNVVRLINGVSALLLAVLPGKATILEGMHGWELRPTFRGPRLPRWMENGVSSFNQFIHELSVDSDTSSIDYTSGEEDDYDVFPDTPLSQSSRLSRASSSTNRRQSRWIKHLLSWIMWPATFLVGIPLRLYGSFGFRRSTSFSISGSHRHPPRFIRKSTIIKDHIVSSPTDRRRGVIEDLQLSIEISIEAIFDVVHKAAHILLSPAEAFYRFFRWFSFHESGVKDIPASDLDTSVPTATLGEHDPTPTERQVTFHQSLNTDARTCQDVITELGYPYEAIRVITSDGYVLLLERIPRRDSRKAVYLQHGIMDSSMGYSAVAENTIPLNNTTISTKLISTGAIRVVIIPNCTLMVEKEGT